MPLLKYQGGVRADEIVEITMIEILGLPGVCAHLKFAAGSQATVIPSWAEEHKPEVGGYFVVKEGKATFIPADKFDLGEPIG